MKEISSEEQYQKANQLSWELAMWLPSNIYKSMTKALIKPDHKSNPLSVIILVRKELLGNTAGDLIQDDITHHAPGIGNN